MSRRQRCEQGPKSRPDQVSRHPPARAGNVSLYWAAGIVVLVVMPFVLAAIAQTAITVVFAVGVCGLHVVGSLGLLLAVAIVDALLGTTLGLLASAFVRTEFQVVQFMPAFVFPQILLGGIFVSHDQMPDVLHAIGDWLPLSHAIDALSAVASKSHSVGWIWQQIGIIAVWIIAAITLAALTLRRRSA